MSSAIINRPGYNFSSKLGLCQIDENILLMQIKEAIIIGSKRNLLAWADFAFEVNSNVDVASVTTFEKAVDSGMPYIDATNFYYCTNKPESVRIRNRAQEQDIVVNPKDITLGLFCWYFSLYTQGTAIANGPNNFISRVLGLGPSWRTLVTKLSSASMENMPKRWIKAITFSDLSEETRNRLSLGTAGHRFLQALTFISAEDYKPDTEMEQRFIRSLIAWTEGKVYWDLHPVFKSANIITVTRSLNKSINDCLFYALTDQAKNKLVSAKILFDDPIQEPAHAQWRSLNIATLPSLASPIFP